MRLAVLKETAAAETRVAAVPETVKKLIGLGMTVAVQSGAGAHVSVSDADYAAAGAEVAPDAAATLAGAAVVFAVQMPEAAVRAHIARGTLLVCVANASTDPALAPGLAEAGIDVAAMELLPRITRAQSMDVLSSRRPTSPVTVACIEAAGAFDRGFRHDDDRRRHRAPCPRVRGRRRRGRPAGHRHRAPARRHRLRRPTCARPQRKKSGRSALPIVGVEDEESAAAQTSGGYAQGP